MAARHQGRADGLDLHDLHRGVPHCPAAFSEALVLDIVAIEHHDLAVALQHLPGLRGDAPHRLLQGAAVAPDFPGYGRDDEADHRSDDKKDDGELPGGVDHEAEKPDDGCGLAHDGDNGVARGVLDLICVIGDLRNELAGLMPVKEADRHPEELREHLALQRHDHGVADVVDVVVGEKLREPPEGDDADYHPGHPEEHLAVVRVDAVVQKRLDGADEHRVGKAVSDHADDGQHEIDLVIENVTEEPSEKPRAGFAAAEIAAAVRSALCH